MKNSEKVSETVTQAKSNLDQFINPPLPDYAPIVYNLEWLDPSIIVLVLFGGIMWGVALVKAFA